MMMYAYKYDYDNDNLADYDILILSYICYAMLLCGPLRVAISWNGADVRLSVCLSVCHVSYLENGAR